MQNNNKFADQEMGSSHSHLGGGGGSLHGHLLDEGSDMMNNAGSRYKIDRQG